MNEDLYLDRDGIEIRMGDTIQIADNIYDRGIVVQKLDLYKSYGYVKCVSYYKLMENGIVLNGMTLVTECSHCTVLLTDPIQFIDRIPV